MVDRLLTGLTAQQKEQLLDGIQIKHLYVTIKHKNYFRKQKEGTSFAFEAQ